MDIRPSLPPASLPPATVVRTAEGVTAGGQTDDRDADGRDLSQRRRTPSDETDDETNNETNNATASDVVGGPASSQPPTDQDEAVAAPAPLTSLDIRV